jgi:hypothetical protein
MPRGAWLAVALLATGTVNPARAQPLAPEGSPPLASTPVVRNPDRPAPVLGAPVSASGAAPQPVRAVPVGGDAAPPPVRAVPVAGDAPPPVRAVVPTAYTDPAPPRPQRAAGFGAPSSNSGSGIYPDSPPSAPIPAAVVESATTRSGSAPGTDTVNDFLTKRSGLKEREPDHSTAWPKLGTSMFGDGWGEKLNTVVGEHSGGWFRSDHLFDSFISPVSNPFLFEDPRSLTEVRPIFIYQQAPSTQHDFRGGHITYFGVQGRLAFTDRWSLVVSKLGGIWLSPGSRSIFPSGSSFAELWLGPKWTFYRCEETGSVAAGGLQFQFPTGSAKAFQNTGSLSLNPYLSYAQNFLRDWQAGSFNFMASTGFDFATDNERSSFYWLSSHLDFDVAGRHRFYPLAELNWVIYTGNGKSTPIGAEGRDLANFGGQPHGSGLLTLALGGRGKINENAQLGGVIEFPIAGPKDLFRYRFTIDFILRY